MSVDLFCYGEASQRDASNTLNRMKVEHQGLFAERFLISAVNEVDSTHEATAREYGMKAHSFFLVGLNQKDAADMLSTVVFLIKTYLGEGKVVVLFENEEIR